MLHVRVDDDTKAEAASALAAVGLSVSDAVRLFLRRVVADQVFSLEPRVPNVEPRAAMVEADEIARIRRARFATADELIVDHPLRGDRQGHRECHIGGDFLLAYRLQDTGWSRLVLFVSAGTHADLLGA